MNEIITVNTDTSIVETRAISADLFDMWVQYIDARPKTVESYTRSIRQFYRYLQDKGITQPTRADVITFKEELIQTCKPATVNAYLQAMRLFFKWTEQEHLYPNICDRVKSMTISNEHKKDALSKAQAQDLLSAINTDTLQGKRDLAIISLMITTGMRTIEVSRANIEDLRTQGDFTCLYLLGKGRDEKAEYVKVAPQVEKNIRAYLKERGRAAGTEPLFASVAHRNNGQRMTTRSISRLVKDNLGEAGFDSDRLTAHSLRHTAGTLALLNGATLQETQQLLRHKDINTTMIYLHNINRASNNSELKIASAIYG